MAKEFFQIHDKEFSGRSVPDTARTVDHHKYSMAWLPAGEQWRTLRRIAKEYLFSVKCLDRSERLREVKVQELVNYVNQCSINEKEVNINAVAFTTTLNILSNFIFSMDLGQYDSVSSQEFMEAVSGLMEVVGKPNLADFFPILKSLDPQGLLRRANVYGTKLLTIIDRIIDQRLQKRLSSSPYHGVSCTHNDVLDSLLNLHLKDESEFSRNDMIHLVLVLFIGGTDTTSNTFEWAMVELIRNPEKMKIARSED
ncbi:hypothetical protein L6452_36450 [Arctium lappa]|uniref:Uncharacterized protein n=1 Tax=Arctium lappa TaxID=4217 RepID=A0ACB8Y983_ARCLA|nr:hypothetical protein L6452_36450 [Arctium lappa]